MKHFSIFNIQEDRQPKKAIDQRYLTSLTFTEHIYYFMQREMNFYIFIGNDLTPYPCKLEIVEMPALNKCYAYAVLDDGRTGYFDYDEFEKTWRLSISS